jgi:hypothetical protein
VREREREMDIIIMIIVIIAPSCLAREQKKINNQLGKIKSQKTI